MPRLAASAFPEPSLDLAQWDESSLDLLAWDDLVRSCASAPAQELHLRAPGFSEWVPRMAQTLCRYQRFLPPAHPDRSSPSMRRLLRAYRRLHDFSLPLVLTDFEHSVDTWRWLLRLEPRADLPLQCAALLHDVERLESEAERRIEHLAPSYSDFKRRHAERGGAIVSGLLTRLDFDARDVAEARRLVERHEHPTGDPRLQLLNDADGISFLSLNAYGYLRYFGPEQTRKKLTYTFTRMSREAEAHAGSLLHHPLLQRLLSERQNCPPTLEGMRR